MFKEMRRNDFKISGEGTKKTLADCRYMTLAMVGEDGYPYSLPISFVYEGERLFIHGYQSGHKVDALTYHEKVSFSAVCENEVVPKGFYGCVHKHCRFWPGETFGKR